MPIKPENRARYPANWKDIRAAILERADNRCEKCGVRNGHRIVRGKGDDDGTYMIADGRVFCAETGKFLGRPRMCDYECTGEGVDIVLTIAHLDHMPENCDPSNLRAWCQRCHLRYDAAHHAETARATRKSRLAIADMFATQQANTEQSE